MEGGESLNDVAPTPDGEGGCEVVADRCEDCGNPVQGSKGLVQNAERQDARHGPKRDALQRDRTSLEFSVVAKVRASSVVTEFLLPV